MTLLTCLGALALFFISGGLTILATACWGATMFSTDNSPTAWVATIVAILSWVLFFHSLPIKVTLTG